jgi:hypothetical protein
VPALVDARLVWDYVGSHVRIEALYERSKAAQWNGSTDLDWAVEVPYGGPLPDDSAYALASFSSSPLARAGRPMWDTFRWEVQTWMVSQFLHGEQGAMLAAARLVETVPDVPSKRYAAAQAADEARHVEVFGRYLAEKSPGAYPPTVPLLALLADLVADSRWDVTMLGMHVVVEALAMAAFRLADRTFHDPLVRDITRLVARDEARHVSFGVLVLRPLYAELTTAERADREELVLEAASLMRRRFLMEDVWQRLGVDRAAGAGYAATDPLLVAYRRAIFTKVVTALADIGLLTERVRDGLAGLDLLGPAGARRPVSP